MQTLADRQRFCYRGDNTIKGVIHVNKIIAVAGLGYVGLSLATLLAQHNKVLAVDVSEAKVAAVNNRQSPIRDEYIEKFFAERTLDLTATLDASTAYAQADFVIVAVPTNYDPKKNFFDTSAVNAVIEKVLSSGSEAFIVIKSTIPVGFVEGARKKFATDKILFSPEFCASPKPCTTTCTRRESSSARIWTIRRTLKPPANLPNCCAKVPLRKIFRRC